MAQLTYNDKLSGITGMTPFFANYGKNANGFLQPREGPNADKALVKAEELKEVHKNLRDTIENSNKKVRLQADKNRKDGPQLKEGDKVYLLTKNIKTKRPSKKLDHVMVGLFLIVEQRGPVNYRLELPRGSKRHLVFHVSLLEPADPSTPVQDSFHYKTEEEDEYEVEKILDQKGQKYLIK